MQILSCHASCAHDSTGRLIYKNGPDTPKNGPEYKIKGGHSKADDLENDPMKRASAAIQSAHDTLINYEKLPDARRIATEQAVELSKKANEAMMAGGNYKAAEMMLEEARSLLRIHNIDPESIKPLNFAYGRYLLVAKNDLPGAQAMFKKAFIPQAIIPEEKIKKENDFYVRSEMRRENDFNKEVKLLSEDPSYALRWRALNYLNDRVWGNSLGMNDITDAMAKDHGFLNAVASFGEELHPAHVGLDPILLKEMYTNSDCLGDKNWRQAVVRIVSSHPNNHYWNEVDYLAQLPLEFASNRSYVDALTKLQNASFIDFSPVEDKSFFEVFTPKSTSNEKYVINLARLAKNGLPLNLTVFEWITPSMGANENFVDDLQWALTYHQPLFMLAGLSIDGLHEYRVNMESRKDWKWMKSKYKNGEVRYGSGNGLF